MTQGFAKGDATIPIVPRSGTEKVDITADTTNELLRRMLQQLLLLNMHQALITETKYTTKDINKGD